LKPVIYNAQSEADAAHFHFLAKEYPPDPGGW